MGNMLVRPKTLYRSGWFWIAHSRASGFIERGMYRYMSNEKRPSLLFGVYWGSYYPLMWGWKWAIIRIPIKQTVFHGIWGRFIFLVTFICITTYFRGSVRLSPRAGSWGWWFTILGWSSSDRRFRKQDFTTSKAPLHWSSLAAEAAIRASATILTNYA